MRNISDIIEQHLKGIIQSSQDSFVEIQRNELAELFQCVPSQINYVISTRFTIEKGYVVESKRGGGGYIRIKRMELKQGINWLGNILPEGPLSQREAEGMIQRLFDEKVISIREARILEAAVQRDSLGVELPVRDLLRSRIFKAMLLAILRG